MHTGGGRVRIERAKGGRHCEPRGAQHRAAAQGPPQRPQGGARLWVSVWTFVRVCVCVCVCVCV